MSTEIVTTSGVVEKQQWARAMAPAALLPKAYRDNPANLFLAAELADSLDIERINALTSIHVIEGKPSASADLMAALVRRAGHKLRITGNDQSARAVLVRVDDPDFEFSAEWDMNRARQAGLVGKDVWKKYPGAMLRSRAITEVIREGASEVLVGMIYTPEELGARVDASGQPTQASPATERVTVAEILDQGAQVTAEPEPLDVTDAEIVEEPTLLTDRTRGQLFALFAQKGIPDRDRQIAGIVHVIGRPIESRSEITEDEARAVILALQARPDAD